MPPVPIDTLAELFASRRPAPSTVLMEIPDGQTVTYGDADRESARLARALNELGVRPGDRVAVQVEKSPAMILLYVACVRAGAVLLPMNPAYTDDEVAYLVGDAEPAVVVQEPERAGRTALSTLALAELAAAQPPSYDDVARGPDDLAAILYTSGTTGKPKGAMLTQRNLASNAAALHAVWGFAPDDVLLHALPIFHTHGLFVALHCALLSAARILWLPRFDAGQVAELLPEATVMMGVPTFYTRLLAHPAFTRDACRNVRLFVSGSAPLLPETFEAFRERTGQAILERYGMTETGMITSNPLAGARAAGTVGCPLPGVSVRVVDDAGAACGPGAIGNVQVRGPNVFAGYWQMPEKTREEFTGDGWFRTGDVGEWVASGGRAVTCASSDAPRT